eukprot:12904087-Prorocentrum_lima.AAC.1
MECHDWKKGFCRRGISCNFRHDGIGRCVMSAEKGGTLQQIVPHVVVQKTHIMTSTGRNTKR